MTQPFTLWRRRFRFGPAVLVLALLLAACGAPPPPTATDSGSAPAAVADSAAADPFGVGAAADAPAETGASADAASTDGATTDGAQADGGAGVEEVDARGLPVGFTDDGRPYRGRLSAPVRIEEFSDYQCPFCARFFSQTLPSLEEQYIATGEAVLLFFDFPLTSIHPQAVGAAVAARCAGEQGPAAYWNMHDVLFENLGNWSVFEPEGLFTQYAAEIGIDTTAFGECLASGRHEDAVSADVELGRSLGINGTPSFFINGRFITGAQPLGVFQDVIAAAQSGEPVAESEPPAVGDVTVPDPIEFTDNYGGALGDPDAKVTIVEFTDYQCPFCARHSEQTFPTILAQMIDAGRVRYVLKDLPLESIHPEARIAAAAARCAGEQDAYWEMHDELFAAQDVWSGNGNDFAAERFIEIAGALELDVDDFAACVRSDRYDSDISANVAEAQALGVNGTPFFFIQGYPVINGAQPYEVFDLVVGYAEEDQLVAEIEKAIRRQQEAAQAQQQPPQPQGPVDVPIDNSPYIGSADAPVVVVEYTDFQCPFCSRHYNETYPQIVRDYVETGLVRYVFKDFPLDDIHPQATPAAEAARCAGDQSAYAAMHDMLFARQVEWNGQTNTDSLFSGYANELGLDGTAFKECLDSDRHIAAVQADLTEGIGFGVRGTPAFFINGTFVSGAQPYSVFQDVINQALGQ